MSAPAFFCRVLQLALAALLVGLARLEVGLPVDVVDVERGAVRVEVVDLVDDGVEHLGVVADDDEPALVGAEVLPQPDDRVGVEVVGRLVEQQGLVAGEEDSRQLDAATLATGEGAERLAEDALLEVEGAGDGRGLGLGGIPTLGLELHLEPGVLAHRLVADLLVVAAHPGLGLGALAHDGVEPAGREDAVAGEHLEVTGAGVLRQVADGAGAGHRARGGLALAGEHLGQGRLARTVAADETDAVAGVDPEAGVLDEQARSSTQLDPGGDDHGIPPIGAALRQRPDNPSSLGAAKGCSRRVIASAASWHAAQSHVREEVKTRP